MVVDLAFKPTQSNADEWLAVALTNEVRLWKKGISGAQFQQAASIPNVLGIAAVSFSGDGGLLAIGTASTEIFLRDVSGETPEFIDILQFVEEIPSDLIFHPTHPNLLAVTTDKGIQIWEFNEADAAQRDLVFNQLFTAGGVSLRFAPEGTSLVVGAKDAETQQALNVWNVETQVRTGTVSGFTAEAVGGSFPGQVGD